MIIAYVLIIPQSPIIHTPLAKIAPAGEGALSFASIPAVYIGKSPPLQ
jgi:hypothetical protein